MVQRLTACSGVNDTFGEVLELIVGGVDSDSNWSVLRENTLDGVNTLANVVVSCDTNLSSGQGWAGTIYHGVWEL
jgi:hypothetical protein